MANTTLLHQLFPIVRAEVLRLLCTNPGQELYVRELARLAYLSLQTVQDELAKLEASIALCESSSSMPLRIVSLRCVRAETAKAKARLDLGNRLSASHETGGQRTRSFRLIASRKRNDVIPAVSDRCVRRPCCSRRKPLTLS